MRVKKINIGIKDLKTALTDFAGKAEAIERGEKGKKESGLYFASFEAFRKALTREKFLPVLHTGMVVL